jgi:hypothetical protein
VIRDEVMFVAANASAACDIALTLIGGGVQRSRGVSQIWER